MKYSMPVVDNYSFPSGHASRVFAIYFYLLCKLSLFSKVSYLIFPIIVCLSRLFLARHTILDVIVGIGLGYIECLLFEKLFSQ
ncbi:hypothetical protein MXB_3545 [Myxobolus squamalis]|nr:hypothetical protein MXB_3545 [Myxobolus squamalis]